MSSQESSQLSLPAMYDHAELVMLNAGGGQQLDTETVILATHPYAQVHEAAINAHMAYFTEVELPREFPLRSIHGTADTTGAANPTISAREAALARANSRATAVELRAQRLARPARRRDMAIAMLSGLVIAAGLYVDVGAVKYDLDIKDANDPAIASGKPIIGGTTIVSDKSILPGGHGKNLPVVGPILEAIPGVPDFDQLKFPTTTTVAKKVISKHTVIESGYSAGDVRNPVAHNLQLTGVEYRQGRKAAARVLKQAKKDHLSIKHISVEGLASDDFGGKLGSHDPEQQSLADKRAQMASKALKDEAEHRGIKLGVLSVVSAHEAVLSPSQISKVNKAAKSEHMTTEELLQSFDKENKGLKSSTKGLLKRYLKRGAKIELSGTEKVVKNVKTIKMVEAKSNTVFGNEVPGEAFAGFGALMGLCFGLVAMVARKHKKFIRKAATKEARKAGIEI